MNRIELIRGDITKVRCSAIVNAANSSLLGGGGVDGAIHRAGGPDILRECRAIVEKSGPCKTGHAVYTGPGNLPCDYIIHTVGPIWHGGINREAELLGDCYINSLKLCSDLNLASVSFPNISTGVYGFPKREASIIAINSVSLFLSTNKSIKKVIFVCYDSENYNLYSHSLS